MTIQDTIPYVTKWEKGKWRIKEAQKRNCTILVFMSSQKKYNTAIVANFHSTVLNDIMPDLYGFRIKFKR